MLLQILQSRRPQGNVGHYLSRGHGLTCDGFKCPNLHISFDLHSVPEAHSLLSVWGLGSERGLRDRDRFWNASKQLEHHTLKLVSRLSSSVLPPEAGLCTLAAAQVTDE